MPYAARSRPFPLVPPLFNYPGACAGHHIPIGLKRSPITLYDLMMKPSWPNEDNLGPLATLSREGQPIEQGTKGEVPIFFDIRIVSASQIVRWAPIWQVDTEALLVLWISRSVGHPAFWLRVVHQAVPFSWQVEICPTTWNECKTLRTPSSQRWPPLCLRGRKENIGSLPACA